MTSGKPRPLSLSTLRPYFLGGATLLAAYLLYKSLNPAPDDSSPPTQSFSPPASQTSANHDARISADPFPENTNALPTAPEGAIPNEAILVFDSQSSFQNFLESAPKQARILSANTTLRSIRIRIQDLSQLGNANAQIDFNYTLLTPLPIVAPSGELGPAFEDSALDFVRAPQSNGTAGEGITIAILDTGVRDHATLEGTTIEHFDLSPTASPTDYASHGTAVASLIAGKNGNGIAPAANLISIRVLDTEGIGDTFSLAEGIVQAVDAGAEIINMSLGSYGSNQTLANAIDYATSQGVVLVASAGNESVSTLPYPAAYDSVIAVGAIDADGHPSYFSNQSDAVDIAAPGVGVYAAWDDEDWISFTGTSASAPYVSGAIAALSSELDISARQASTLLLQNANDTGLPGNDPQTGNGYIDIQRSLDSNTSYTDLALADIYLDPIPSEHGQYTVHLTAQNRGTETIASTSLEYTLPNGIPQTIYLGPLAPGQSASHPITLNELELASQTGYPIKANTIYRSLAPDSHEENNEQSATLSIKLPEE